MHNRTFSLAIFACVIATLALTGCQGRGGELATPPAQQAVQPAEQTPLAGIPSFPPADEPGGSPRIVSAEDNILLGNQDFLRSATANNGTGDSLVLDASTERAVWGMWRWGEFSGSIVPLTLELDVDPAGGEYWLLVSDYRNDRWRHFGPLTAADHIHTYDVGINHVSQASGYSYVVLVADGGNTLTVNQLNMTADDDVLAPAAPLNLTTPTIEGTRIELSWTANTEPDLDGYDIYSGPAENFPIDGPGVTDHGHAAAVDTTFWVNDLDGETEYHFRITAYDALGNVSPPSNTATATTLTPSQEPTNLQMTDISGNWADISWEQPLYGPPLGYEIYTGPTADFEVGDAGVVKHNGSLVTDLTFRITGLAGLTEYHCRVRGYFPTGGGPLSNVATFTTEDNSAPIPSFTVSPQFVESGEDVLFNPFGTTDEDTPPEELIFKWDYDNDGTDDHQTTGPEVVTHVFHQRGPMTTKLTVNDGSDYSTTRDYFINYNYDYIQREPSTGNPGEIIAVDTDPATSRIAVLHKSGTRTLIQYFDGTWSELDVSSLECIYFADVALSPGGVSVLVSQATDTESHWTVFSYSGGSWSEHEKILIEQEFSLNRYFDFSANGRMSVAVIEGYITGGSDAIANHELHVWHEKADGTYSTADIALSQDNLELFDVRRNDTTTYFVYGHVGNFHQWEFTDSSSSDAVVQTYSGDCDLVNANLDHDNDTHLSWIFATDSNRLYYGDNHGSANGSQFHSLGSFPLALLGCGFAGDNETIAYWAEEQADGTQRLMEYDSVTGGGTESVIASATGIASGGGGHYYDDGMLPGVYTVVDETRDGELTGRFMSGGTVQSTEWVYTPTGGNANIMGRHVPLVFADGTVLVLNEQGFGTARASEATSVNGPFTDFAYGENTWCIPQTACITSVADEFFVASYRDMISEPVLELNRFTLGTSEGTTETTLTSTSMPRLAHHPVSDEVILITGNAAETSLSYRTWNGAAWSGSSSLISGSAMIEAYTLAPNGTQDWGLALIDDADNVRIIESTSGVWGSATTLTSDSVNGPSGIGLSYHSGGALAIAVERSIVDAGVYLGSGPDSGSLTWEEVSASSGNQARYIWTTYTDAQPQVLYYLRKTPSRNSRIQVVEKFDTVWETAELPNQIHGSPVGITTDSSGNIIMAGYNMSADPRYASIGILIQ